MILKVWIIFKVKVIQVTLLLFLLFNNKKIFENNLPEKLINYNEKIRIKQNNSSA